MSNRTYDRDKISIHSIEATCGEVDDLTEEDKVCRILPPLKVTFHVYGDGVAIEEFENQVLMGGDNE
jgi:hypothetical protein